MPLPAGHPLQDAQTGHMSVALLTFGFGAIVILYTMFGGLWAVLMTDVLQFVILNLSVIFVLLLTVIGIPSLSALIASAPPGFFEPTGGGYGWLFLAGWCTTQFFIIGADWAFAQRFLSVRTPRDARKATYLFGGLYLVSPFIWLSPPLIFRLTHPGVNPEQAYILAGQAVLPAGLVGLMVAAMFSATASTVSGYLNVFAGVLTNDVYRRIFRPAAPERELVKAGRVFSGAIGLALIAVAILLPHLGGAERIVILWATLIVGPLMAPTVWGLLSPRVTTRALWMTVAIAFLAGVLFKMGSRIGWSLIPDSMVDVVVGVILPVIVLTTAHFLARDEAPGWRRVQDAAASGARNRGPTDTMPARALGVSLTISGIVILVLVPFDPDFRVSLGTFGAAVLLLGVSVWLAARRLHSRVVREHSLEGVS
jgi:Na+/proline symporter